MKTKDFLKVAEKITKSGIYYNLKKGQHMKFLLGISIFGSTKSHYLQIWRNYGTLYNIVITEPSEKINEILQKNGITEFIAKPTKSKRFCRLHENTNTNTI